jgi:type II secretory pathway pseudopilin PulG
MKNQQGTTLVELIIYIGIVGMIMVTISSFLLNLLNARAKTVAISEVLAAGRLVQDRLTDAMRHAEGINTVISNFGSDQGVLSLDMVDGTLDPTIFSLTADDGSVQVQQGVGSNQALTPSNISITNFLITNLTTAEDVGIIQVQFTAKIADPGPSNAFDYEEDFQTTLRIPLDQE